VSTVHEEFVQLIADSISDGSFRRVTLAKPRAKQDCQRITIRQIILRGEPMMSIVQSFATNDITKNVSISEAQEMIRPLICDTYLRSHLATGSFQADLSVTKKGAAAIHRTNLVSSDTTTDPADTAHDRVKKRFIAQDRPYLTEIGITDRQGRVVPAMARKWKQINRFVEIVDGAIAAGALNEASNVSVVDFGCGKGYLTFALHDHLTHSRNKTATVIGVELRPDLVSATTLAAHHVQAGGLSFLCGDIETAQTGDAADILVALHACDTATDAAIYRGIQANASVIVCSPCCHKELRTQMKSPAALSPMLNHGVHLGQEADMVTDTLRALLLEQHGYDTKVFEFIGLEETSKNKMILAVKRQPGKDGERHGVGQQIADLKAFYSITTQRLESLLAART
jgi:SAM-dependent methyltransferase